MTHIWAYYVIIPLIPSIHSQKPVPRHGKQGLAMAPINKGDTPIMPYKKRLRPWILVRLLPNLQRVVVGRFRSWSDAEGHLRAIK
ncbi:MAG: hypothetical protein EAZ79_17960 [Oscillatoriales cyanobacterium]|nr:MAG: hypothetical protein EAZ79_17960 [Oscillatoriales cyanobacterium]TAF36160.1 MAG: hypothetical protein EAZ69_11540 [Oscillatoriales cyanobacterium]